MQDAVWYTVELNGRSLTRCFSELGSIIKKLHLKNFKLSPAMLQCPFGEVKRSRHRNQGCNIISYVTFGRISVTTFYHRKGCKKDRRALAPCID